MTAQPVEWVLAIFYGISAHRATYGRLSGNEYTKDYIQLSRKSNFVDDLNDIFPQLTSAVGTVAVTYAWTSGTVPGQLVALSADRPHLKWDTNRAPGAWKMSMQPSETAAETIPGDPTHSDPQDADDEFSQVGIRGAGQPYLLAIKLRDEAQTLHVRAYLKGPDKKFSWADIQLTPPEIQDLIGKTSQRSALAASTFKSSGKLPTAEVDKVLKLLSASQDIASDIKMLDAGTASALTAYLKDPAYGLFFNPVKNHDAWRQAKTLPKKVSASVGEILGELKAHLSSLVSGDAVAETLETSAEEVELFRKKIEKEDYEVDDAYSNAKTRGSAQKAFAEAVKKNYNFSCAITGINTEEFLIASHIVPWSEDKLIRLDPSNGICLSALMDRAFEKGYIIIDNDFSIHVKWERVGNDKVLAEQLKSYDGKKLRTPPTGAPKPEYLERRRKHVLVMT